MRDKWASLFVILICLLAVSMNWLYDVILFNYFWIIIHLWDWPWICKGKACKWKTNVSGMSFPHLQHMYRWWRLESRTSHFPSFLSHCSVEMFIYSFWNTLAKVDKMHSGVWYLIVCGIFVWFINAVVLPVPNSRKEHQENANIVLDTCAGSKLTLPITSISHFVGDHICLHSNEIISSSIYCLVYHIIFLHFCKRLFFFFKTTVYIDPNFI